tara:strand:- start:18 stop:704 length:687 start_codon:yes stop_codon:yes gene_type:complete
MESVKVMIISIVFGLLSLVATTAAIGNDSAGPTPIIESTTSQIMAIVGEAPEYFDTDPDRFYNEIGAVLDETIDWRGFARGVMGEYASSSRIRSLTKEERASLKAQLDIFTDTMKTGLIQTYAKGLLAFSGSKFEVTNGNEIEVGDRSASVTQLVYGAGGKEYTIRYDMRKSRDGLWKIRNLNVEGLNLGQIYRSQFASAAKSANGDVAMVVAQWNISSNLPEDLDIE